MIIDERKLPSILITQCKVGGATRSCPPVTFANIHCDSVWTLAIVFPERTTVKILKLVCRKPYDSALLSRSRQSLPTTNPGNRHKTQVKYDNLHTFLLAIISPKALRVKSPNCKLNARTPCQIEEHPGAQAQADIHKRECCIVTLRILARSLSLVSIVEIIPRPQTSNRSQAHKSIWERDCLSTERIGNIWRKESTVCTSELATYIHYSSY